MPGRGFINPGTTGCSIFVNHESPEAVPVIDLIGEVDLEAAPKIYSAIWQASEYGRNSLVLNLEKLDFMDSSGLQALLRLREKLRTRKQNIVLAGAKPQIKKLFRLTGFDKLFPLAKDSTEAVSMSGELSRKKIT